MKQQDEDVETAKIFWLKDSQQKRQERAGEAPSVGAGPE